MAQTHYKTLLRKALLGFITKPDPVLAMLQWVAQQMMLIEAEAKVGAEKGKHAKDRKTHFSGARVRRDERQALFPSPLPQAIMLPKNRCPVEAYWSSLGR